MRFFEIKAVTNIDKGEEIYIPASDHKKATYETKIKGYEIYHAKSKLGPMPIEHFLVKDPESNGFLGELKLTVFYKYYSSDVFFNPKIQGKGIALPLYAYVVKKGYTLVSDREQSRGSQTIWKKLSQLPGIFVYAWDRKYDEFFQWNPEEEADDAIYQDKNDIRLVAIASKQETNENFADGKKISDAWFKDGFKTYKVPAKEKYVIADKDGTVKTLEGPVKYKKGFYIMTGPKGENYPIPPEKFKELKDDHGNGIASPKKIIKIAKLADHDGVVNTSWGATLKYAKGNDYIVRHGPNDYGVVKSDIFKQTYKQNAVEENFADGKKKGKSRPGRVKRAGASCNGSVTALRKRAKNASGEKAKMYHWCANMKSGRKKK